MSWTPAAILPNLRAKKGLDGDVIAIVPGDDPRVQNFCQNHSRMRVLLSRFTDAFRSPLSPPVLIVRNDERPRLSAGDAFSSFRDLVALSVVPYARAASVLWSNQIPRIYYADTFTYYPWKRTS